MSWIQSVRTVRHWCQLPKLSAKAKVCYRQFGASAELSWCQNVLGPKCLSPEISLTVIICKVLLLAASHAAHIASISVTRGDFEFFCSTGATCCTGGVMGWDLAWKSRSKVDSFTPNLTPHQLRGGVWGPKSKNCSKILAYKRPAGAYTLGQFLPNLYRLWATLWLVMY